jgi:hypothetical protein
MHIFISHECGHFLIARVLRWFSEISWKVCLPVRVNDIVAQILEKFNFTCWPFVKVHRFNFSDMHSKLSMDTYDNEIVKCIYLLTYLSI